MERKYNYVPGAYKVASLEVHEVVKRFGGLVTLPPGYKEGFLHFKQMEVPVITEDGKVLTHVADFLLAKELGLEEIEVLVCDIDELELPFFSGIKQLLHVKDYPTIYEAILYYTELLKSEAGRKAGWLTGNMDERLEKLIGCGVSKIKKIRTIGNKKPHELGLLQHSQKTWDQVFNEIKLEELERESQAAADSSAVLGDEESGSGNGKDNSPKSCKGSGYVSTSTGTTGFEYYTSTTRYENGNTVEVTVTKTGKEIFINGKKRADLDHELFADADARYTEAYSHIWSLVSTEDVSFQTIVENPKKLFEELRDEESTV